MNSGAYGKNWRQAGKSCLESVQVASYEDPELSSIPVRSVCLLPGMILGILLPGVLLSASESSEELRRRGEKLYTESCADCHGIEGEGVEGAYELPLVGDDSVMQLSKLISDTMPEGEPEACVANDADAVAAYIHYEFYSEAAQVRRRPPRIQMARLTAEQLRQSLADLYSSFDGTPDPKTIAETKFGLEAEYFDHDGWRRSARKLERVDSTIDFDFGRESPVEGVDAKAFSIQWKGGLLAPETGRYQIVVDSTCSFVLYLGEDGREFINNYVQSGDQTEFRRSVTLIGGRVYPIRLKFRQRKRKTEIPPARVSLRWVPPEGDEQVVPERNLLVGWFPKTFALQADLPPDDRSYGYERGISVNRAWDESTTSAALEFADMATEELWPHYQRAHRREGEGRSLLPGFLEHLVSVALRTELTEEQRSRFIDRQLAVEPDDALAIKRVCLVALKSPGFLYPLADAGRSESERIANRLALTLFDSLPTDGWLRTDALRGKFESEDLVRAYAEKYVEDHRTRAKTRDFLHAWLNLEHLKDISKSEEMFPGFDEALVSDLRRSLDAFLDHVVWSESSDFRELLLSHTVFTNDRIGGFYGGVWEPKESTLDLAASDAGQSVGVLHHPYMLSGLAYHDSTSPIHRGVFLTRYSFGRVLRPPAEAFTPLSPDLHPDLTTRQRVELQTSPDACQVCHTKINSLGFTLENYDAVGRWREKEGEKTITTDGFYIARDGTQVDFSASTDLAKYLAESDDSQRAFVSRAFQHFVKQPPAAFGADTLDQLTAMFRANDCSIRKLLVEIAVVATRPRTDIQFAENDNE